MLSNQLESSGARCFGEEATMSKFGSDHSEAQKLRACYALTRKRAEELKGDMSRRTGA